MRIINLMWLVVVLIGCKPTKTKNQQREIVPEPDRLEMLKAQKATIDSQRMTKALTAKIYAKQPNEKAPNEVVDLKWPKEIDEVYNVWYNGEHQIVCVGAYPFSHTGDWNLGFTHYFDAFGNTFAFERNTSFYNSICTDDLAIEQIVMYYANDKMVDSTYVLTDVKGNQLLQDSCEFPYDFPYRVYTHVDDVLKAVGLKPTTTR